MFVRERHAIIRKIVRERRRLTFAELEDLINVSPATLRRDLTELADFGDIVRVHGGVLDPSYVHSELTFGERILQNGPDKKAIAAAAADLVPHGSTVFVDAGSTCLEAGKLLLERKDVRVITHSLILLEAALHGEAEVLCIGGELRKVSAAFTGASALGVLDSIRADVAFIGASGLDPVEGCSTTELSEAEMKKALLKRAERKILLADHTKWQRPSVVRFAGWTEFSDWVTDRPVELSPAVLKGGQIKIHTSDPA